MSRYTQKKEHGYLLEARQACGDSSRGGPAEKARTDARKKENDRTSERARAAAEFTHFRRVWFATRDLDSSPLILSDRPCGLRYLV